MTIPEVNAAGIAMQATLSYAKHRAEEVAEQAQRAEALRVGNDAITAFLQRRENIRRRLWGSRKR